MKKYKLTGRLIFSGFYFVTGVAMVVLMVWFGGDLPHLGFLGALSMIASYGLSKMKRWVLFVLVILLFTGVTFSLVTIYAFLQWFGQELTILSMQALIAIYMVMLVISFLDALSKRKKFV
ncbi:MAG: hypothetical protein ACE5NN_00415 [Candidatus Bathyarchaeia archaeon]